MFVNDGNFVKTVGMGQEFCGRIFSRPICFVMALFHTVLEGTTFGMYSQSTRGPELLLLKVV